MYIALETTGLPNNIPGFNPTMVALGVAFVANGEWQRSLAGLICQPQHHLEDPRATRAWELNGLSAHDVTTYGSDQKTVVEWLEQSAQEVKSVRGFNVPFLEHFLPSLPWKGCVMAEAAARIQGSKRIAWKHALDWALESGFDVTPPAVPTFGGPVGAAASQGVELKASSVAKLAIALRKAGINA